MWFLFNLYYFWANECFLSWVLGTREPKDKGTLQDTQGLGSSQAHLTLDPGQGVPSWTLVAVKPDGVQQRLVGDMIQHFEQRVFGLVGMKLLQVPECVVAEHYHDLQRKPFYPALISYMSSGPMVAMVWEGPNMNFSVHISRNVIHASDSVERAKWEILLWFQSNELVDWAYEGHHGSIYPA
ncbi:Nucleoside diphosphate kinase, mitochondrial [Manis javanica]|nr:Nucleoside diphosphate kinase, mitochondrial [Manis javanica]